jgi:hypothetical protein
MIRKMDVLYSSFTPNGRGARSLGCRLFYEDHIFNDTDPRPSVDFADGIPNL